MSGTTQEESSDPGVPRARAKAVSAHEKRMRIERIMGLMARGEWVRGESDEVLAEEWGLAESSVRDMAGEASRLLAVTTQDVERIEEFCRFRLKQIAELDLPSAVQAIQVLLKNIGRLNDKVDLSVTGSVSDEDLIVAVVAKVMKSERLRGVLLRELQRADPGLLAVEATGVPLLEESNGD